MRHPDKTKQKTLELTDIINQMDLADMNRTFSPYMKGYTIFSAPHGTFSKINHVLGHKASLNRHKKIEMLLCIKFNHHKSKLGINNKRNNRNVTNSWELSNSLSNVKWVKTEMKDFFGIE